MSAYLKKKKKEEENGIFKVDKYKFKK